MLDGWARPRIDPLLDAIAPRLVQAGVSANAVTVASFVVGLASAVAAGFGLYLLALALMLLSRLGDGLDGAVAARTSRTDLGGYLDIVLDFFFYGALPLGFVLANPAENALAGGVLLATFYINGASFLAFAVMAEKRGISTNMRGTKSLYFTAGLMEATETILFFVAMCLLPFWFAPLAFVFSALTFWTAVSRIVLAVRTFS